ncbi:MAG: protein kinase [Chloroflexi bacterium]|nr:protein kinase [Chloroflexota bacterium]
MHNQRLIADRFELGPLIGEGGVGLVYHGRDIQNDLPVAVKMLKAEVGQSPEMVERFYREAQALRDLNHPGIIKLLATYEDDTQHAIVMEYMDGGSLADYLAHYGPLAVERTLDVALEAADALVRAHHLGIIHRDIKPGNILIADDGTIRLTDFGLAHLDGLDPITKVGKIVGTFSYLSPEGCNRQPLDARTDIWSLGVVLYEMLTGRRPFEGNGHPGGIVRAILSDPVPILNRVRGGVPPALETLIHRMLAKNREMRIGSMRQVAAELEAVRNGSSWQAGSASFMAWSSFADPSAGRGGPQGGELRQVPVTTKVLVPPPRLNQTRRQRLLDALNRGLAFRRQLTLVAAPAGFGKTTLISDWISSTGQLAAWFALDEADNDPLRFLSYLLMALQQVNPNIGRLLQDVLGAPQGPPIPVLLPHLVNDLAASHLLILVLDDYHVITESEVHQILQYLIDNQPPSLHLVLISREDPPIPLPRLRVRDQLTEIRQRDLRFTASEVAQFLQDSMHLELEETAIATLGARTEGWIAGLQLAALALQEGHSEAETFIAAFTGSDRYVMDYLIEEVVRRQPPNVQTFLKKTAVLDRLTAPLCNALVGREDGEELLDYLDRSNLFLIPLDHHREWYRYHHLFADVLRSTLNQSDLESLHWTAMVWYEDNGYYYEAVQHALERSHLTDDPGDVERLISKVAAETLHGG